MIHYIAQHVTWRLWTKVLVLWISFSTVMVTFFENSSLLRKIFLFSGGLERISVRVASFLVFLLFADVVLKDLLKSELGKGFDPIRCWIYLGLSFTWLANLLAVQKFHTGGWALVVYFGVTAALFVVTAFLDRIKKYG
jgi:hypothetical protein